MLIRNISFVGKWLIVVGCVALAGCDSTETDTNATEPPIQSAPVAAGDRLLGLAPVPAVDAGETFDDIFPVLDALGMKYIESAIQWDEVEVAADTYDFSSTEVGNLNVFLPLTQWRVSLSINAVDTNVDRRPLRLRGLAWDSLELIDAYWAMVETSIAQFSDSQVLGISIGNEVDIYFAANNDQQDAYVIFVRTIQARLKEQYPGLRNGVKTTVAGALNGRSTFIMSLNQTSDVVMASYYAIDNNFQAVAPVEAIGELNAYVGLFPNRDIHFLEMGAMSSSVCGSSNEMQAQFVNDVFSFWDTHADQVKLVNFMWMSDISTALVDQYNEYYGVTNPCFREYLASLGLRDSTGSDKGALATIQASASVRAF